MDKIKENKKIVVPAKALIQAARRLCRVANQDIPQGYSMDIGIIYRPLYVCTELGDIHGQEGYTRWERSHDRYITLSHGDRTVDILNRLLGAYERAYYKMPLLRDYIAEMESRYTIDDLCY